MTTYRGLPACTCHAAWLPVFEAVIGRQPRLFQLVGDAPDSAGFHKGGGSIDYEPLSEDELRTARNMGGASWNRPWEDNEHSHIRLNGCPHNTIAQPQVADLNARRDGTGPLYDNTGEADNGPRTGVHWPLRTWREGIEWGTEQLEEDMAYTQEDRDRDNDLVKDQKARAVRTLAFQKTVVRALAADDKDREQIKGDLTRLLAELDVEA